MRIREATQSDFEKIWPIFREIASAGETYAYPRDVTKDEGEKFWMEMPRKTFVAESPTFAPRVRSVVAAFVPPDDS